MAQEGSLKSRIKTATPCIMQHACCNVCTVGECGGKGSLAGDNVHCCPGTSSQYSCVPNASSFFPSTSRIQPLALSTFVSHLLVSVLTLFRLRFLPFSEHCFPLSVISSQWFESDVQAVLSVAIISTGQGQNKFFNAPSLQNRHRKPSCRTSHVSLARQLQRRSGVS